MKLTKKNKEYKSKKNERIYLIKKHMEKFIKNLRCKNSKIFKRKCL